MRSTDRRFTAPPVTVATLFINISAALHFRIPTDVVNPNDFRPLTAATGPVLLLRYFL